MVAASRREFGISTAHPPLLHQPRLPRIIQHIVQLVAQVLAIADAHKRLGDGDFVDRVFGEGDADGVADAVGEQRPDADSALDPAILAIAGFSDAKVDRVIPVRTFGGEAGHKQPVGLDHDLRVGCLHRKYQLVVVAVAGDSGKFEGAFDNAQRGVAVAVHDAVGERSVVGADAHGSA